MTESTKQITFASSDWYQDQTAHGLAVLAYEHAKEAGLFAGLKQFISLPIKTVTYTVQDKLATLWASILVGCDHTLQINVELGPQERALAAVFGLERFPEQSTINRLLGAATKDTVAQMRQLHFFLLERNTRARRHALRRKLAHGRVLFVDFDQRGISVRGKQYEVAERGHFSRARSHRGYQLSLAFLGGQVGEVLDEYFDPGATPAGSRIDDFLSSLQRLAVAWRIPPEKIAIRADAQYGSAAILEKIAATGFSFLIKDISTARARALGRELAPEAFAAVSPRSDGEPRWAADLGQRTIVGQAAKGEQKPTVTARTLVLRWEEEVKAKGGRPGPTVRAKRAAEPVQRQACYASLLTNLAADAMPTAMALDLYDERATIERYFRDEQSALGARSVRTHRAAGAALFQWMVAMTSNLLGWMKARHFVGTPLERYGAQRLVHVVMQIPARLRGEGARLRVLLPERHMLVGVLMKALGGAVPESAQVGAAPPEPDC